MSVSITAATPAALAWLCWALLAAGCASSLPTRAEYQRIEEGTGAIVLLHFDLTVDGEPITLNARSALDGTVAALVTQFGEPVLQPESKFTETVRFFEAGEWRDGWVFCVLAPGTYYLEVSSGSGSLLSAPEHVINKYEFRVDVPLRSEVVYIGTLRSNVLTGKLLFGRSPAGFEAGSLQVMDDTAAASTLAAECFADLHPPTTSIMFRYEGGTREVRTPLEAIDTKR